MKTSSILLLLIISNLTGFAMAAGTYYLVLDDSAGPGVPALTDASASATTEPAIRTEFVTAQEQFIESEFSSQDLLDRGYLALENDVRETDPDDPGFVPLSGEEALEKETVFFLEQPSLLEQAQEQGYIEVIDDDGNTVRLTPEDLAPSAEELADD